MLSEPVPSDRTMQEGKTAAMNAKQRRTLGAIYADPVKSTIAFRDVESLLLALGAEMTEGSGSRLRFSLGGVTLFVHRPHPQPQTKRYVVRNIREFLEKSGVKP